MRSKKATANKTLLAPPKNETKSSRSGREISRVVDTPTPYDDLLSDDLRMETPKYMQWITRGNGVFYPEFPVKLVKSIPTGYYGIGYDQQQSKYFVRKQEYTTDNILELPMPEIKDIIKDIVNFWKNDKGFSKYNLTYKRGILMYGPPGCGKSHVIQLIIKYLIEQQRGVVFKIETDRDVEAYSNFMQTTFKVIEKTRRIVTIIEDIDELFQAGKTTETLLLNILDGMGQMDNIVYVATTNYPEELAERIINRPSRFDRRYPIELPNDEVRKYYFENTLKEDDLESIDIDQWVKATEGMSVAHLRELIVSTVIQGNTFEETVKILKDFTTIVPTSKKFGGKGVVGFGAKR